MRNQHRFHAVIENAGGGGAYIRIPFDVQQVFGKKRVKVKATLDGEPYRGSLVRMGTDYHMLPVLKEIRARIGKDFGDEIEVMVEEDTEPRQVEIPPDLRQALEGSPEALAFFNQISYTNQREYVRWIDDAKRDQTRLNRIAKTIEQLKQEQGARQ